MQDSIDKETKQDQQKQNQKKFKKGKNHDTFNSTKSLKFDFLQKFCDFKIKIVGTDDLFGPNVLVSFTRHFHLIWGISVYFSTKIKDKNGYFCFIPTKIDDKKEGFSFQKYRKCVRFH